VPGYGYVLGMHAFGLEETGLYDRAEDAGRKALDANRRDPWAVHAVAHVMEMQGRIRDGIDFLSTRAPDWSVNNGLAYHNWWHLALHHLELAEHDRALEIFDTRIRPAETSVALEMLDASALLWRLTLRGVDVGSRWKSLAACWQPLAEDRFYAFNDAHAVMAFVGAEEWARVDNMIASLERAAQESGTNGMMSREVGLPLARAIAAFGRQDYAATIDLLTPVRPRAHLFGGSHAQAPADPLPSWNDGAVKKSITDFIPRVTTEGSADFVPPDQRIATFDNDGTLWAEQPMYFQLAFALDRVKALAAVVGLAVLVSLPAFPGVFGSYAVTVFTLIFFYGFLGQAWNVVGGYAGQLSAGHAAFLGIGAYTAAVLSVERGITPWIGMFAGKTIKMNGNPTIKSDLRIPQPELYFPGLLERVRYVECSGATGSPPDVNC